MLVSYMEELRAKVRDILESLRANDALRELLSTGEFQPLLFRTEAAKDAGLRLKYHTLNPTTWRTLEHAGAMTSLYAAYERFVYDLLREWLSQLPTLYARHSELRRNLQRVHRIGTAKVIEKIDHHRYRHLSLPVILRDLTSSCEDAQPYRLLPEAFFSEDDNLRKDPLEALLGRVGIENAWQWIMGHPSVVNFIDNIRGEGNTAESELAQFISYRNDAAHGSVDTVLGLNAIGEICVFVESLCEAVTELVRNVLLQRYLEIGRATRLGRITEVFHRGETGIGRMEPCTIRVRDELVLVAPGRCSMVNVLSLRDNDIDCQEVVAAAGQEVGIRLTTHVRKNMVFIRILDPIAP
jgi:RiboL-PSP-HEPN